jgi:thiamine transport system permease protein
LVRDKLQTLVDRLDKASSRPWARRALYVSAMLFLFVFIILPPVLGTTFKLGLVGDVLRDRALLERARSAIFWSFAIAFLVALLDLVAGLPLAWLIARGDSRFSSVIDTLVDVPFIIPTVALGYSTLQFWSGPSGLLGGSLLSPGLPLVLLLHFAFSYPVIVRVMVGGLLSYDTLYETAARTLGAKMFTVARTITLPMLRPTLVAAFLLAFARSLSETGATIMVAGAFENGPLFIQNAKDAGLEGPMVLVSMILIVASVAVFALIRVVGNHLRLPLRRVWPESESQLSSKTSVRVRDSMTLLIFGLFVLLPSLFITLPTTRAFVDGTLVRALRGEGIWSSYWQSMLLSYGIGVLATLLNMAAGIPVAILIARKRVGPTGSALLEAVVNIPIVVPSVALGVSLSLFWRSFGFLPEFWIMVLSHTTITYTYFVKAIVAALESIPEEMEETARTLGSRPLNLFRRLVLPISKYSIFSGAILTFTRSVNETGAASAVARELKTTPVLLVSWVRQTVQAGPSDIALGISLLLLTSFAALLALRLLVYRRSG